MRFWEWGQADAEFAEGLEVFLRGLISPSLPLLGGGVARPQTMEDWLVSPDVIGNSLFHGCIV